MESDSSDFRQAIQAIQQSPKAKNIKMTHKS